MSFRSPNSSIHLYENIARPNVTTPESVSRSNSLLPRLFLGSPSFSLLAEKRELLANLKSRLVMKNKTLFLEVAA
jgi:hypothetical protein